MILGFKQYFPWHTEKNPAPTFFREKILAGVGYLPKKGQSFPGLITHKDSVYAPKIHTFREDIHDRWKPGMSIQMVYRGPKYSIESHFNKGIEELEKCKSIQKVHITVSFYNKNKIALSQTNFRAIQPKNKFKVGIIRVFIDEVNDWRELGPDAVRQLIINDGFSNAQDFYNWFGRGWKGKIIHWTDFRY